ncbi:MAG: glutamyl-tRNA(Gln) amidotransferase subunit [Bacillota bacterium]|jgi:aspartyl-tRNA(Asn)/glutamyl-tRNA(Gln) amidotransferase subunit A
MLLAHSIATLQTKLTERELSVTELLEDSLTQIKTTDQELGAFITIDENGARAQALKVQQKIDNHEPIGLLAGIPIGVKDLLSTKDVRTTCGSKMLENFIPIYDAHVVQLLKKADAVIVGKTNMDEFAMGSSTEHSAFFPTRNPWDKSRVPGGSSGGSAAAVGANQVVASLGSDTGGSIRQPASFCGLVGLKPTYGLVSRFGLVAFASSLDQIGPFTHSVEDAAYLLQAIAGHDPHDSTSYTGEVPNYINSLQEPPKKLTIALPRELFTKCIDKELKQTVQTALEKINNLNNVIIEEVSMPHLKYAMATYYLLAPAEASANLARFDGIRYGVNTKAASLQELYQKNRSLFGPEVKRRIMIGTHALSSGHYDDYYLQAQKARTVIREEFLTTFKQYDLIVSPTTPTTAFKLGEINDPLTMYLNDICSIPANLAGLPALSLPCGLANKLPVGLQLIGPAFGEQLLLRAAYQFEQLFIQDNLFCQEWCKQC